FLTDYYREWYCTIGLIEQKHDRPFESFITRMSVIHTENNQEKGKTYVQDEMWIPALRQNHQRIIIEAAAGMGKSTVGKDIARRQAWGKSFRVVLMIELKKLRQLMKKLKREGHVAPPNPSLILRHYFQLNEWEKFGELLES